MFFCEERPRGSLPVFTWDDVTTPIRPITERRSLSPRSSARTSVVPYGSIAQCSGRKYGFTMFRALNLRMS